LVARIDNRGNSQTSPGETSNKKLAKEKFAGLLQKLKDLQRVPKVLKEANQMVDVPDVMDAENRADVKILES
jgi:hypothetical protein